MVQLSTTLNHKGKKYKVYRGKKGGIYIIRQNKKLYLQDGSGVLGTIRMKAIKKFVLRMPRMKQKGGVQAPLPWECKQCTYSNKPLHLQCDMCKAPKNWKSKDDLDEQKANDINEQFENRNPLSVKILPIQQKNLSVNIPVDDINVKPTILVLQATNADDVFDVTGDVLLEEFFHTNKHAETYNYQHRRVENINEAIKVIKGLDKSKICHLIIMGHGSQHELWLSDNDTINRNNVKALQEPLQNQLVPGAVILLHSCCVGFGGVEGDNLARKLTNLLPDNDVFASESEIATGDLSFVQFIPDESNHKLLHVHYSVDAGKVERENRTLYDIHRFVSPKRKLPASPKPLRINFEAKANVEWMCNFCTSKNKPGTLACNVCRKERTWIGGKVYRYKFPDIVKKVKKVKKKAIRGKKKVIRRKKKVIRRKRN